MYMLGKTTSYQLNRFPLVSFFCSSIFFSNVEDWHYFWLDYAAFKSISSMLKHFVVYNDG